VRRRVRPGGHTTGDRPSIVDVTLWGSTPPSPPETWSARRHRTTSNIDCPRTGVLGHRGGSARRAFCDGYGLPPLGRNADSVAASPRLSSCRLRADLCGCRVGCVRFGDGSRATSSACHCRGRTQAGAPATAWASMASKIVWSGASKGSAWGTAAREPRKKSSMSPGAGGRCPLSTIVGLTRRIPSRTSA
jgi:hypothetical protein